MNTFYASLEKREKLGEALATLQQAAGDAATIEVREASGKPQPSPMIVVHLKDGQDANALAMRALISANAEQKTTPIRFVGATTSKPPAMYHMTPGAEF